MNWMTDVEKRIEASRERIKRERPALEPLLPCTCQDCRRERGDK